MNENTILCGFFASLYRSLLVAFYQYVVGVSPRGLYNLKSGLPVDWHPQEYLGPSRLEGSWVRTPGGIRIQTRGFDMKDIPDVKKGSTSGMLKRARVDLLEIDRIWAQALIYYSKPGCHGLSVMQQKTASRLKPDYPMVVILPTIKWSEPHGCYVGGLCVNERIAQVAVWYESVSPMCVTSDLESSAVTNWQDYLLREFGHVIKFAVGEGFTASDSAII